MGTSDSRNLNSEVDAPSELRFLYLLSKIIFSLSLTPKLVKIFFFTLLKANTYSVIFLAIFRLNILDLAKIMFDFFDFVHTEVNLILVASQILLVLVKRLHPELGMKVLHLLH